jgi:hypothetical protein
MIITVYDGLNSKIQNATPTAKPAKQCLFGIPKMIKTECMIPLVYICTPLLQPCKHLSRNITKQRRAARRLDSCSVLLPIYSCNPHVGAE